MKTSCYQRPAGVKALPISHRTRREAPEANTVRLVSVNASTQCHVTPANTAAYMAECLEIKASDSILEPHAGTGNLLAALIDEGATAEQITGIELNHELFTAIKSRFEEGYLIKRLNLINDDFLEWAKTAPKFDKIIVNPPFSNHRRHVSAAIDLLKPGGVMVALLPASFNAAGFEMLAELDADTFACAKVRTKVFKFIRGDL